jgi:murein DD-endopeptidase MepM/ murein hydrolase activator NlpD
LIATVLISGCATIESSDAYKKTRDFTGKAVTTLSGSAKAVRERMKRYLAEKDLLKTFHDAGVEDEEAVLGLLHHVGVTGPKVKVKTPPASGGKPLPKPGGGRTFPLPQEYSGGLRWPLDAGIVSSEYGQRWGRLHKGIDIAAETGEPVHAAAEGNVIYAGDGLRGYGNVVILRHDEQTTTLYAHNSALEVHLGDHVRQGDVIALLGSTGRSTGPHTHFEIREGDRAVDPRTLLPKAQF